MSSDIHIVVNQVLCKPLNLTPTKCIPLPLTSAGVTDHFAQDEPHALAITRNIFSSLNLQQRSSTHDWTPDWEEPLYDPKELRGAVPADSRTPWDVRSVLGRILDGSRFEEFKSNYGKTLVTGDSSKGDADKSTVVCMSQTRT